MVLLYATTRVSQTWCRSFSLPRAFTRRLVKLCALGSSAPPGSNPAGMHERLARCVLRLELNPALVKVALLRNQAMPDALVLNHDDNSQHRRRQQYRTARCPAAQSLLPPLRSMPNMSTFSSLVAQKLDRLLHLLIVAVVL